MLRMDAILRSTNVRIDTSHLCSEIIENAKMKTILFGGGVKFRPCVKNEEPIDIFKKKLMDVEEFGFNQSMTRKKNRNESKYNIVINKLIKYLNYE